MNDYRPLVSFDYSITETKDNILNFLNITKCVLNISKYYIMLELEKLYLHVVIFVYCKLFKLISYHLKSNSIDFTFQYTLLYCLFSFLNFNRK